MSDQCCTPSTNERDDDPAYKRALTLVLALNVGMLVVELIAGFHAGSLALLADALDFLGDSATYAISIAVLGYNLQWRARAALAKGISMGVFGIALLCGVVLQALSSARPDAPTMGIVGCLALAVNLGAAFILLRYRTGDANRRSVWLCSRNDALGNLAVILAAGGVAITDSHWPDLLVASGIAVLALYSSWSVIRHALAELSAVRAAPAE